ncbi:MAG TPA: glycosyltransferase, partial [Ramlibacter sp.]|nr:glycosyltransferase [Ramlibacter sp.]
MWTPPGAMDSGPMRRAAQKIREGFLAALAPDMVHVASLFEGGPLALSCGRFAPLRTAVTLYDLIPLQYPELYLRDTAAHTQYLEQLADLRRANLWLAISDASRLDAVQRLGAPSGGCVNISTAAGEHFVPGPPPSAMAQALLARLGLVRPFVMYTGGIDPRKNLEGLVRAFALLPPAVQQAHQLAIVCSATEASRATLQQEAARCGLPVNALVMTGYVEEAELVMLYQLCRLFVFPSWHEGFGLPALEAMKCGAPVIASASSSLPEVVGRDDALFDPRDDRAIAAAMGRALGDEAWRKDLAAWGLQRCRQFSWEATAKRALDAMEQFHAARSRPVPKRPATRRGNGRPRLAFVSPLPPERSGIADYSAELLPELARHYDIELVLTQPRLSDLWAAANCPVRDPAWLLANHRHCDRVLYHFGNSEFHEHMFDLLAQVPGVVVLHDFFLSGVVAYREAELKSPHAWTRALYASHGYDAARRRYVPGKSAELVAQLPCNFDVLRSAVGVISHSPQARELAAHWYGRNDPARWSLIPLLRSPPPAPRPRAELLWTLDLPPEAFVVCTFGLLGRTKMNDRLLAAWRASALAHDANCHLVFVGQAHQDEFGRYMQQLLEAGPQERIRITGWASGETFRQYLDVADLAVQLRTLSRGETSASVLDTMNHGVATIVNANGSMAHLPREAVHMLPDAFSDAELTAALEQLWRDENRRRAMGEHGRRIIREQHAPTECALRYRKAIEGFYAAHALGRDAVFDEVTEVELAQADSAVRRQAARCVAANFPRPLSARQLLVDVSELVQRDAASGIQRVVKNLLRELIDHPPAGFRIEPVYAIAGQAGYRYARRFTMGLLHSPQEGLADAGVELHAGDVFLGLDLQTVIVREQAPWLAHLRTLGVKTYMVVYDLLPLLLPQHFDAGGPVRHDAWLRVAADFDGAVCISRAVADELHD